MSKSKVRLSGKVSVFAAALAGLAFAAAMPARAQSGVTATVVPYGNSFKCVASGTNVTINGPFWEWVAIVDGNYATAGYGYYPGPSPYTGPWTLSVLSVDIMAPATGALHGYHTCQFVGYDNNSGGPGSVLWNTSAGYTFP
jgi:hypothetical protein